MDRAEHRERLALQILDLLGKAFPAAESRDDLLDQARALVTLADQDTTTAMDELPQNAQTTGDAAPPSPQHLTRQHPEASKGYVGATEGRDEPEENGMLDAALPQPDAPHTAAAEPLRPGEIPDADLPILPVPTRLPRVEILANARAGAPYRARIVAHDDDGPAQIVGCDIPADALVHFQDGHLCGESPRAGDYDIQVSIAVGASEPTRIVRTEARLVVNPDPRSLWKNIPSDRDEAGWKNDSDGASLDGANGRHLVVASQRGRSHAHVGAARDDDFALRVTGADGWNVLAVADGAGSAKRSRIGSRVACNTAVDVAVTQLAETAGQWPLDRLVNPPPEEDARVLRNLAYRVLGTAAFEAVKAIEARGKVQGCEPRDYATTLLLALHRTLDSGDLIVTFWVGDGAIGLLESDGTARLLGIPDGGEYAGQTRFLDRDVVTDGEQIMRRIQIAVVPQLEALILMSDGVSDPKFPSDAALQDTACWHALWSELKPLLGETQASKRLLEWLDFWSSGNHDDRTLAVLW